LKNSLLEIQHQILLQLQHNRTLNRIFIGYSGGIDSHVLLHACAQIHEFKNQITAVYIHHGLQKEADDWAIHCEKTAEDLGVLFLQIRVNANPRCRESPEEAARNARYDAFKNLINENDVLLIAQHREDQLETVLLQIFRGSGLKGLAGMPEKMAFSKGHLLRPLLNIGKDAINAYALENQLVWIEDPSNQRTIYDRNFLRQDIIPKLKQRWQSLDKTVSRTATHCAEAEFLISNFTQTQFQTVLNEDKSLDIAKLLVFSKIEQRLILREWFAFLHLKMPSQDFLQRIIDEVIFAGIDRHPILHKKGVTICRKKNTLFLTCGALDAS
jgi:tRNA(Ile)-lysidine synthase